MNINQNLMNFHQNIIDKTLNAGDRAAYKALNDTLQRVDQLLIDKFNALAFRNIQRSLTVVSTDLDAEIEYINKSFFRIVLSFLTGKSKRLSLEQQKVTALADKIAKMQSQALPVKNQILTSDAPLAPPPPIVANLVQSSTSTSDISESAAAASSADEQPVFELPTVEDYDAEYASMGPVERLYYQMEATKDKAIKKQLIKDLEVNKWLDIKCDDQGDVISYSLSQLGQFNFTNLRTALEENLNEFFAKFEDTNKEINQLEDQLQQLLEKENGNEEMKDESGIPMPPEAPQCPPQPPPSGKQELLSAANPFEFLNDLEFNEMDAMELVIKIDQLKEIRSGHAQHLMEILFPGMSDQWNLLIDIDFDTVKGYFQKISTELEKREYAQLKIMKKMAKDKKSTLKEAEMKVAPQTRKISDGEMKLKDLISSYEEKVKEVRKNMPNAYLPKLMNKLKNELQAARRKALRSRDTKDITEYKELKKKYLTRIEETEKKKLKYTNAINDAANLLQDIRVFLNSGEQDTEKLIRSAEERLMALQQPAA